MYCAAFAHERIPLSIELMQHLTLATKSIRPPRTTLTIRNPKHCAGTRCCAANPHRPGQWPDEAQPAMWQSQQATIAIKHRIASVRPSGSRHVEATVNVEGLAGNVGVVQQHDREAGNLVGRAETAHRNQARGRFQVVGQHVGLD